VPDGGARRACRAMRQLRCNAHRNRHCQKCPGAARAQWLAARHAELLPVHYFHVVFTVPAPAGAHSRTKRSVYAILFRSAAARSSNFTWDCEKGSCGSLPYAEIGASRVAGVRSTCSPSQTSDENQIDTVTR
jgi:hypothetical protein